MQRTLARQVRDCPPEQNGTSIGTGLLNFMGLYQRVAYLYLQVNQNLEKLTPLHGKNFHKK